MGPTLLASQFCNTCIYYSTDHGRLEANGSARSIPPLGKPHKVSALGVNSSETLLPATALRAVVLSEMRKEAVPWATAIPTSVLTPRAFSREYRYFPILKEKSL